MRLFLWLALAAVRIPSPPDNPLPLTPPLLREQFVQDVAAHRIDDLLALFTPDAEVVSAGAAPVAGQSALRSLFSAEFAQQDTRISLTPPTHYDEGEPRHPTAIVDTGRYTESVRTHTGEIQRTCGAYTFRYTKNPDGGWRIARMDWTSEPCAAAPPR